MLPNDDALKWCPIEMPTVRDRHPIYLVMDALDECLDTSEVPSPRNRILWLLEGLAELRIPKLRICVTSRPEFDIRDSLIISLLPLAKFPFMIKADKNKTLRIMSGPLFPSSTSRTRPRRVQVEGHPRRSTYRLLRFCHLRPVLVQLTSSYDVRPSLGCC